MVAYGQGPSTEVAWYKGCIRCSEAHMTIVGRNEIFRWETLVGPLLVHKYKLLGPRAPPPLPRSISSLPAMCTIAGSGAAVRFPHTPLT